MLAALLGALALAQVVLAHAAMSAASATPTLRVRQDSLNIFPTRSASSPASYYTPAPTSTTLTTAATVPVAPSMGLVIPQAFPYKHIYLGGYEIGWVEVAPAHPPIVGGWMRMVSPVVVSPDYSVRALNVTGSEDPRDSFYYPVNADMCSSYAVTAHINTYNFTFTQTGWHMLVVNQTWMRPTISNGTCHAPLIDTRSFYATALISIAPLPTAQPSPRPAGDHTTWVRVTTETPGSLPAPPAKWGERERIAVGLGVGLGGVGALAAILAMLWIKRRRFLKAERIAFDRMKPEEREEYLATNPRSVLNPHPPPSGVVVWFRELRADIAAERARKEIASQPLPPQPQPPPAPHYAGIYQPQWVPPASQAPPPVPPPPLRLQPGGQYPYPSQQFHPAHLGGLPPNVPAYPPYVPHPPHPPASYTLPNVERVRAWQAGLPRRFSSRAVS